MVNRTWLLALLVAVLYTWPAIGVEIKGGKVIKDRTIYQQIAHLKSEGYDVSRLDGHTQLKIFLYTWLAMERGEGGMCDAVCDFEKFNECMRHFLQLFGNMQPAVQRCMGIIRSCPEYKLYKTLQYPKENLGCCPGWKSVMEICTKSTWYDGPESKSIKQTTDAIANLMIVPGS